MTVFKNLAILTSMTITSRWKNSTASIKKIATLLFVVAVSTIVSAQPVHAQTREWGGVCLGPTEGSADVATIQGLECLIANVFIVIITLVGLAGFVMFCAGGIIWMFSGNDSKNTATARQTMTYAVIGIVVTLSAFIVLNLISAFTGISIITQFRIPTSEM